MGPGHRSHNLKIMKKEKKTKKPVGRQLYAWNKNAKQRYRIAWLMILPAILLRILLVGYPFLMTFYNSFFNYKATHPNRTLIGFANYAKIFADESVKTSISFTLVFTVITVVLIVIIGTMLALLMNAKFKGRNVLRTVILIPWAVPVIVCALGFQWAFNDTFGFINDLISRLIGQDFSFPWLGTNIGAQIAVIFVEVWKHTPMFALLVLSGLQAIPEDLYESARIDGASKVRMFFSITLPQISKLILSLMTFQIIWRATGFELVYAMTAGGPGTATSLLSYRIMLHSVKNMNYGYASAISMVMFVVLVAVITIGLSIQRRVGIEGDAK